MRCKKKGFIFFTVVIITILITSVTLTVFTINTSHARDIVNDAQRNSAYYIAYAGLETVYAALNDKNYNGLNTSSAMESTNHTITSSGENQIEFNGEVFQKKEKIIPETDISLTLPSDHSVVLGRAKVYGDLLIREKDPYFRIVSTGYINADDNPDIPADTHTLTMFVFKSEPNRPKIYSGNRLKF